MRPTPEPGHGPTSDRPLLTLAMIVRDGGQFLDRLLLEATPWVDEIVIGDTGSHDRSAAVAQRRGARVLDVPWRDDFAAARNAVLDECRGAWILILDADERLDPAGWSELRSWVAAANDATRPQAACLVTRNYLKFPHERRGWRPVEDPDPYLLPEGPPAAGYVPTAKVRLVPNRRDVRLRGLLHETFEASLCEAGVSWVTLALPVHHFGTLDMSEDKTRRYLHLAERKAAEQPHDPSAWAELADCGIAAGELRLALVAIDRSLALAPGDSERRLTAGWLLKELGQFDRAVAQLTAVAESVDIGDDQLAESAHLRAQINMLADRREDAGPLLALATRLMPENGHYLNSLGVWHLLSGRGDAARRALEQASRLLPHLADPCYNLGRMYEAAGHTMLAARHFELALQRTPDHAKAAAALTRLARVGQPG